MKPSRLSLLFPLVSATAFSSFAQTSAWDCDPVAWREGEGGAFEAIGSGFALAPSPKGAEVGISGRITPVSTECPEYATLGLSLFDDLDHYWNLSLVKSPDSKGGGPFCEMKCRNGGAWLDWLDGMKRTKREGDGKWRFGRAYDMSLRLTPEAVEGLVRDAETGAVVFHAVVARDAALPGGAPRAGGAEAAEAPSFAARPALSVSGDLRARAEAVRFDVRGEVPDNWRTFPAYRPVGPETGVSGRATGFFHTEKIDGVDWAVDPLGRAVILAGTDWCSPRGAVHRKLGYAPYTRFVKEHYGSDAAWAADTAERLRSWGFTFLACGGDESLYYRCLAHANAADRLYFSHRLCLGTADPDLRIAEYRRSPCTALPNVFHPDFEAACQWWARQRCAAWRDDPWLVGYFIDNELAWWGEVNENKAGGVFDAVMRKPDSHSAKKALTAFLAGRRPTAELKVEFLRLVAERYFAVTTAAIRKVDPNHMILGCRFAGGPKGVHPVVMETAGKYCDIVSFNHYPWADLDRNVVINTKVDETRVADLYRDAQALAKKPFILTEWSFPALDTGRPCTYGAGQRFHTQAERVRASELYVKTLLSLPFFAGYSYFRWLDQPAEGISKYFPENTNYGLVNEEGVPYEGLTGMFARVQGDAVRWHGAPPPQERPAPPRSAATERERFFRNADASVAGGRERPASGGSPVGFRQESDGAWVLSNAFVRLSGRVGGRSMADEIAYARDTADPPAAGRPAADAWQPVGRWGALLQGSSDNIPYWVDVSRATGVSFARDEATGIVTATIRAEGGCGGAVAGGAAPPGLGFAFAHRLSLAPGRPEILAELVSLENTGTVPFNVHFLFMRPFALETEPVEYRSVPNLWKGPVEGFWQLPDGSLWGVSSRDPGVVKATLWRKEGETAQHPDVRCMEGEPFALAPGAVWRPSLPMGALVVRRTQQPKP